MRVVRRARPGRESDTAVTQVVEEGAAPPGGPPPEPPLDRELWPWLLVLLVLVIAGIVAAVLLTRHHNNRNSTPTETATAPTATRPAPAVARVTIPSLVGSQASDAVRRLRAQGLQPRVVSVFSTKPRATVVAQRPAAGARLARGSTVTLNVSKGQAAKPVPDVVGQTENQAVALLKAAGFGATPVEVPSTETKGTVVAQNPKAGDKAQPDTKVRLNVSKGATSGGSAATPPATTAPAATTPAPAQTAPAQTAPSRPAQPATVTVPAVEGKTLDDARRALRNAGIVTAIRYVPSDLPSGTVVAQARQSGTTVKRGDHMLITVSFGPQSNASALVTVPNVVGLDEQTAQTRVQGAGFDAVVEDSPTSNAAQDGKVVDEQPAGGTKAPKGSQIILYIGRATSSG
jgi:eukaryotic-like serine/threonine-protein kinase